MKNVMLKNTSSRFLSVHLPDGRVEALAPGSAKPLRMWFRKADGSPDLEAAKANDSVKQHLGSGDLVVVEEEVVHKKGNVGKLYNESDSEPQRVAKILEWRRKVKADAAAAVAGAAKPVAPAPASRKKEPKE